MPGGPAQRQTPALPAAQSHTLSAALVRSWNQRGLLAYLLWPLSVVYGALALLHRSLFAVGVLRTHRLPVVVVVVGNVVAGGGGKTPVVIALAAHLRDRGIAVGIVSRGYGRRAGNDAPLAVTPHSDVSLVGDEPLLLARRLGVPVFVGRARAAAARALLGAHPETQVILSDDGLQHHALQRDISVCVFDARGVGNGFLLPAGPLRERGISATWVLQSDALAGAAKDAVEREVYGAQGRYTMQRRLASSASRADGSQVSLASLAEHGPVVAVAGIAQPEGFFAMLRNAGLTLAHAVALPDHYSFDSWKRPFNVDFPLVCTEKDAVKLWPVAPDALAVPLVFEADPNLLTAFDAQVDRLLASTAAGAAV
jgi:tetraacyldisaccharide 4'-kinase